MVALKLLYNLIELLNLLELLFLLVQQFFELHFPEPLLLTVIKDLFFKSISLAFGHRSPLPRSRLFT